MNHRDALLELLIYMVTSASGLENEPHIYGPLRMIEAAQRLCRLLLADSQDDKHLAELISIIEDGKQKALPMRKASIKCCRMLLLNW